MKRLGILDRNSLNYNEYTFIFTIVMRMADTSFTINEYYTGCYFIWFDV